MSARHRLPETASPLPTQAGKPKHARPSTANILIGSIAASVGVAGVLSAAIVELATPDAPAPAASTEAAAPQGAQGQPLSQHGTVVAVSDTSLTARSADGFTQTYALTPDTTAITGARDQSATAASTFAVHDQVAIVGTVRGGTPTATAVAEHDAVGLQGAPMDAVDTQPA